MTHKLSTAVFAQGWLEGQFENAVNSAAKTTDQDPTKHLIAAQILDQWGIFSSTFDQLVRENADMERRLMQVRAAVL